MNESGREVALRIDTAAAANRLSPAAVNALRRSPISHSLSLGVPASEFEGEDDSLIATIMPDDSASLNIKVIKPTQQSPRQALEGESYYSRGLSRYSRDSIRNVEASSSEGNAESVRIGHNAVIDALLASPNPQNVLFGTRYLNGFVLNPYGPLASARRLDRKNFLPDKMTPLYDQTVETLRMVLAKYEQMRGNYIETRTATLLVTDGMDSGSLVQNARSVAEVIKSMRDTGHHIIAGMGIDSGEGDFTRVFTDMGIDPKWILTAGSSQEDIQRVFKLFAEAASQSTVPDNFQKMLNAGFQGIKPV